MLRSRVILAVVMLTWLPYTSVLCVPGVAHGCRATLRPDHEHDGPAPHGHGKPSPAKRTCCEFTGKCSVEVTSWSAPGPPVVAWTGVVVPGARPPVVRVWTMRPVADPTHHPPPYIRFRTLLI